MKQEKFKTWLENIRKLSKRPVSDYISRCKRVERELNINLDSDDILSLMENDEEYDPIIINGNRKNGIASLKSAVSAYYTFSNAKAYIPNRKENIEEIIEKNDQAHPIIIKSEIKDNYLTENAYNKNEIKREFLIK